MDIELDIIYRGEKLPICHKCWEEIAKSDYEWETKTRGKRNVVV